MIRFYSSHGLDHFVIYKRVYCKSITHKNSMFYRVEIFRLVIKLTKILEPNMSEYTSDIEKYSSSVDQTVVDNIVKYCGIALRSRDASTVAASDAKELQTVKDGFAKKKLELSPEEAESGVEKVCEIMKGVRSKHRVTFYYLLAETTGTLSKLQ